MTARLSALVLACLCAGSAHVGMHANEESTFARRLSAIEVELEERGLVVRFAGDGSFNPSSISEAEQWPPRLVIDLPDVTSSVPDKMRVEIGPVNGIRVVEHSVDPLVTRVVFDLVSPASYKVERSSEADQTLTVIFPITPETVTPTTDDDGEEDNQAAALPMRDPGSGVQWVPARAVVTPASAPVDPPKPWRYRPSVPASMEVSGSPEFATASPGVRPVRAEAAARQDDVDLVAPDQREIGRLVDPETLSIPAYLVLGNREASSADSEPVSRGHTSSKFIRPGSADQRDQVQQVLSGAPREYTGDPVSMDFQNAPLRAVLRTLAEISGLNIVIDPQVDGTVDVALTDVPWDQALDIILRANQLGYLVDGTVVRIAPLSVLAAEEDQRRVLAEAQALSGELVVMTRTLSYARADAMGDLITQSVLSARGQVQTDLRTNTLIVTDLGERLGAVEELLDTLDRAEPQVEIEARIVQASQSFAREIGVTWGLTGRVAPDLGNTTPLTFPNRGGVTGRLGQQGPAAGEQPGDARASDIEVAGTAVALAAPNPTSALGVTLGSVDGALNLDVVLSAAEGDGNLRLLSHPRVTTQNNVQAEIIQGDQIPIQTVANNTVTVQFQDAALSLRVTPQITEADTVIMQIEIDNDVADFSNAVNGIPPISTQRARTTVQVANGDTTVIGGIFESSQSRQENRVPGLHRIPLLGWLFKNQAEQEATDELLIFLTPRVVR